MFAGNLDASRATSAPNFQLDRRRIDAGVAAVMRGHNLADSDALTELSRNGRPQGMITEHALLYLGARVFAAAANLAAVAIFTRLAVSDVYGGYLLIFSWAFVIYGFLGQWIGAPFFAVYLSETASARIRALGVRAAGALG